MDENIRKAIEQWVKDNYDQTTTGWTWMRSDGNSFDCFNDGYQCATSWAAYEVGRILGLELEDPDMPEDEDE